MARRLAVAAFTLAGLVAAQAAAEPLTESDALKTLDRIATAARTLNYEGTFVYQHGERVETSRIVHFVEAGNEFEKLETLDGPRREIIRNNDEVQCFYPDAKIVRIQKRVAKRSFPALVPEQLSSIARFYSVRKGRSERVAGFDAQVVFLEPRDAMRYGHKLWSEKSTGLLLKARTINESGEVVEQFAFTQLVIGDTVSRDMVAPSYKASFPEWRLDQFSHSILGEVETQWTVREFPEGFQKIMDVRRSKSGGRTVIHMVYSDGMAAVSIFIESMPGRNVNEGLTRQGAINIYRRSLGDNLVTVLGEAPAVTVMKFGDSVAYEGQ